MYSRRGFLGTAALIGAGAVSGRVQAAAIPEATLETGTRIKVISGEAAGVRGPVRDIVIDPELLDVTIPAGGSFRHAVKEGLRGGRSPSM